MQVLPSTCRAMIGQIAGGGRTEKPLLKAGNAYHKFRVKRNSWPKVCFQILFAMRNETLFPELAVLCVEWRNQEPKGETENQHKTSVT